MNTKIRLYTTAEALASLINLMIDGDYMIDSVKSMDSSLPFTTIRVSVTGSVFVNCPTPLTRR